MGLFGRAAATKRGPPGRERGVGQRALVGGQRSVVCKGRARLCPGRGPEGAREDSPGVRLARGRDEARPSQTDEGRGAKGVGWWSKVSGSQGEGPALSGPGPRAAKGASQGRAKRNAECRMLNEKGSVVSGADGFHLPMMGFLRCPMDFAQISWCQTTHVRFLKYFSRQENIQVSIQVVASMWTVC